MKKYIGNADDSSSKKVKTVTERVRKIRKLEADQKSFLIKLTSQINKKGNSDKGFPFTDA